MPNLNWNDFPSSEVCNFSADLSDPENSRYAHESLPRSLGGTPIRTRAYRMRDLCDQYDGV